MELSKNTFAKNNLTKSVRFITAIKITSKKYCNDKFNAPSILFAIMGDFENVNQSLTGYQRNAVSDIVFSKEKCDLIREFFVDIYNNDDVLLDFLNKKITTRSISLNRKLNKNKEDVLDSAKEIINEDLIYNLDFSF